MQVADVVVVGLGAMGSAAAYQLARRGVDVVGLDRFAPPHDKGSTHGETRITRQAIGEGDMYVPFALRSHEIWREIEAETDESLLLACGALVVSPRGNAAIHHGKENFLAQTLAVARRFGIDHEELGAAEMMDRFPQFGLSGDEGGYFEPGGGLLYPERCVAAQIALARRHGGRIGLDETVKAIRPCRSGVTVTTDRDTYQAGQVVLAAGAWTPGLAGPALNALEVHRQVLFWFEPDDDVRFSSQTCPVYIWMHGDGPTDYFYGFPVVPGGTGVKVATETYHDPLPQPERVSRLVTAVDADAMYDAHVAGRLRGVARRCLRSASCFYTTTPDGDFLIDHHPDTERVLVVSACSGHGFKHSAAIGESVAEWVVDGRLSDVLSGFALDRFAARPPVAVHA